MAKMLLPTHIQQILLQLLQLQDNNMLQERRDNTEHEHKHAVAEKCILFFW